MAERLAADREDTRLDWHRAELTDPRDPRDEKGPCQGRHRPAARVANQFMVQYKCQCGIRLLYVPRQGCSGRHRRATPLQGPADVAGEHNPQGDKVTVPSGKVQAKAEPRKQTMQSKVPHGRPRIYQMDGPEDRVPVLPTQEEAEKETSELEDEEETPPLEYCKADMMGHGKANMDVDLLDQEWTRATRLVGSAASNAKACAAAAAASPAAVGPGPPASSQSR